MTFLKWVGGKNNLLPKLKDIIPDMCSVRGYIEPFLGSGAMFFYLMKNYYECMKDRPIYLSDINKDLINCYRVVRDNLDDMAILLDEHEKKHNEAYYYEIRDDFHIDDGRSDIEKAAEFYYLNKTCFNGIWRVNREGKNNVAIGHPEAVKLYDKNLVECSRLLQGVKLSVMSYENMLKIKDIEEFFVYMDPPYYATHGNDFTSYTKDAWHLSKKSMLRKVFIELGRRRCKVMLSNSYSSLIMNEFKEFNIRVVSGKRMPDKRMSGRDKCGGVADVDELVVMNYEPKVKQKNILEMWN